MNSLQEPETGVNAPEKQIKESTESELLDRLAALRERFDSPNLPEWMRGYALPQIAELHHIKDELRLRETQHRFADLTICVLPNGEEAGKDSIHRIISLGRYARC